VHERSTEVRRQRSARSQYQDPELSDGSQSDISDYKMQEEEKAGREGVDLNGVKHAYRDETWSNKFSTYEPQPRKFRGRRGASRFFSHLPTIMQLWDVIVFIFYLGNVCDWIRGRGEGAM
jgi:hypothetical protein